MTHSERSIMQAVLRYNGIPEKDMAEHIAMACNEGMTTLNRAAYRSYRIIWNSWTDKQRDQYSCKGRFITWQPV